MLASGSVRWIGADVQRHQWSLFVLAVDELGSESGDGAFHDVAVLEEPAPVLAVAGGAAGQDQVARAQGMICDASLTSLATPKIMS